MTKLGVGIIGLGRRWRKRYRRALHMLRDRFRISAVYDAVGQRSERTARRLGCRATRGVVEMLERADIDAVLVIDPAWHGLWPLEAACRFGKPVFCAVPLDSDAQHAEAVCRKVTEVKLPVMAALGPRFAPASVQLQEVLRSRLGSPRLLLCEQMGPRPGRLSSALLDWCAFIFNAVPASVRAYQAAGVEDIVVDFGEGRTARLQRWSGPHARAAVRLRVVAEKGVALADLPHRLRWTAADGRHSHNGSRQTPVENVMLERFHQAVTTGQPMQPSLDDAYRAFRWLRAEPDA